MNNPNDTFLSHWGHYLIQRPSHAYGWVFSLTLLSITFHLPVGWMAAVIVAFFTLQQGLTQGGIVFAWSFLPCAALLILQLWHTALFLSFVLPLSWLLAAILRCNRSWILVIEISMLIAIFLITLFYVCMHDPVQWWMSHLLPHLKIMLAASSIPPQQLKALTTVMLYWAAQCASGLQALFILLSVLIILMLACWWQNNINKKYNFLKEIISIRFGRWEWGALILCILLTAWGIHGALSALLIVLFAFAVEGWSVLQAILYRRFHQPHPWVILLYHMILLIFFPYTFMILSFLGCVDSLINFRYRYKLTQ